MNDDRIDVSALPAQEPPPPFALPQITSELRRAGLLRRKQPVLAYAAAAAAALLIAFFVWDRRDVAPVQASHVLLLYSSPDVTGGSREEYGAWARYMSPKIVGGEELGDDDGMTIAGASTPAPVPSPRLAGYFLIRADDANAAAIARACPHLRHGGAVVLRRIVQ